MGSPEESTTSPWRTSRIRSPGFANVQEYATNLAAIIDDVLLAA
jgi:hypothetical protein